MTETHAGARWPPEAGQTISYKSGDEWKTGVLRKTRWGLVWRDFVLEDGTIVPEVKVQGRPVPDVWREPSEVSQAEREVWEDRLATMAAAGLDPREREQSFRSELNQYLAYTYLRFSRTPRGSSGTESLLNDFPERIEDAKRMVTGRLGELLAGSSDVKERESAAYSLGRLKDIETSLQTSGSSRAGRSSGR